MKKGHHEGISKTMVPSKDIDKGHASRYSTRIRFKFWTIQRNLVIRLERSQGAIDSESVEEHKGVKSNIEGHQPDWEGNLGLAWGAVNLARRWWVLYILVELYSPTCSRDQGNFGPAQGEKFYFWRSHRWLLLAQLARCSSALSHYPNNISRRHGSSPTFEGEGFVRVGKECDLE